MPRPQARRCSLRERTHTSEPEPTPQRPNPTRELTQTHPHSPFLGPERCFRVNSRWAGRPSRWAGRRPRGMDRSSHRRERSEERRVGEDEKHEGAWRKMLEEKGAYSQSNEEY